MANIIKSYGGTLALGTTTKVIPLDTPTAGAQALIFVSCPATQTAVTSGWTKHATRLDNIELSVWTKTLTGSETNFTFTQNAAIAAAYTVVEIPGDAVLTAGVIDNDGSFPAVSGMPSGGTENTVLYAMGTESVTGAASVSAAWTTATEVTDVFAYGDTQPGAYLTVAQQTVTGATAAAASVTLTGGVAASRAGMYIAIYEEAGAPPANVAPTANAGTDQTVTVGATVTLNGSGSSDSDGTIASYSWSRVSGPTTPTLSGSGASRSFVTTVAGTYVYSLTVTDDDGATSAADTVTITVNAAAPGTPLTIVQENALTGLASSQWFDGLSNLGLPAFARSTYYQPGQTAQFSVNSSGAFTTQILRLGHYGGSGARQVQAPAAGTPASQPTPTVISGSNGAVTCAAWSVNATWAVPADATPGWYMALFRSTSSSSTIGHALFVVSDKSAKKPVLVVTGDATWHVAYNGFGGNNVYGASAGIGLASARALCSTYDKPVYTLDHVPQTHFFNNGYPYVKWSERFGYEAGHTTIEQIKDDPSIMDGRDLIVFVGHNEYVPDAVMTKTKALLATGQNMVNAAGNDFFWRVKFTDGAFSSTTNGRVMWCKKDSLAGPSAIRTGGAGTPFTTAADWTGTWQDTRWANRQPSEDFFGDRFKANGVRSDSPVVPASMKTLPPWRNCPDIQSLVGSQTHWFPQGSLGMEWDSPILDNPNVEQVPFSHTTINLTDNASDINGENYNEDDPAAYHAFAMVKNGSSYIANFNSDQWPQALDSLHVRYVAPADANAVQMMLNVQADLGVLPNAARVAAESRTMPTPVAMSAYGFDAPAPDPDPVPTGGGVYWSDGTTWTHLGATS